MQEQLSSSVAHQPALMSQRPNLHSCLVKGGYSAAVLLITVVFLIYTPGTLQFPSGREALIKQFWIMLLYPKNHCL